MNKLKLFIENFFVYGIGGTISKIIPIIMVPIITRMMPDSSYFGISDLSNTIVSFGSAIATFGMYDAMYRFFFDKKDECYKRSVCSTALIFTIIISFIVFIMMLVGRVKLSQLFFGDTQYTFIICISAFTVLVNATNSIIAAPTRMQNKRKIYLLANTISPILAYALSIILILEGYYVIAMPISTMISGIIIELTFLVLNYSWFTVKLFDKKLLKALLRFAIPTIPSFLIFWIFNSCDKIMITNLINVGAAGVYAISSKLGHTSQLIYIAFAGGWQYFAFSTMHEEDQISTNSKIFEYLGIISFAITMLLCSFSYVIFKIVFPKQYLSGYIAAPYLFLAPLLQMLFQVMSSQFSVIKKTGPAMIFLSLGAVINIFVNFILIPILGIEGAAIATLLGYIVAVVICGLVLLKMKRITLTDRFLISVLLILGYLLLWRLFFSDKTIIGLSAACIMIGIYMYFYKNEIKQIRELFLKFTKKRSNSY